MERFVSIGECSPVEAGIGWCFEELNSLGLEDAKSWKA